MKNKIILSALILVLSTLVTFAQNDVWELDKGHSRVSFTVTHLMISEVVGLFHNFDAKITSQRTDWTDAKIEFTIKTGSIDTDNPDRDKHLKSADFFDAEKFPDMKFASTSMKKVSINTYKLKGVLTIKDISKNVEFEVKYGGTIHDPLDKKDKAGFKITGKVNRYDFGLKWNIATTAELMTVSEEVDISCFIRVQK
jgi:polyisoprenoid-binding protein YceI